MLVSNYYRTRTIMLVWISILLIINVRPVKAQKYFFDNYGEEQNLSSSKVYALLQDSKHYIWLGTETGVSRFDGKHFENFTSQDGLSEYGVRRMYEDSEGYIWFGHNNGGVSRFNGTIFERASFDSITLDGDISGITERVSGELWFTSSAGGAVISSLPISDISSIKGEHHIGKTGLSDQVLGTYMNRSGEFFCMTDQGVRRYIPEEKRFEIYRMPHLTTYFTVTSMVEDRTGSIWFGTHNGGLYKYIMAESRMIWYDLVKEGLKSNFVTCLLEDRKGRIWAGTWGGGIALFEGDDIIILDSHNGFAPTHIQSIVEDVEGNILIADQSNGLTVFKGDAFVIYNDRDLLPDPDVFAIHEGRDGRIWLGTNAGITIFTPGMEDASVIHNTADQYEKLRIRFFREDADGNIWIGTEGGGVRTFNIKKGIIEDNQVLNQDILYRLGIIRAMETDRENNLWIGTDDGLACWNFATKTGDRITLMDSVTVTNITALHCDSTGRMWIGAQTTGEKTGLFTLNPELMEFRAIPDFRNIIPTAILMDYSGTVWVGTAQGLMSYRNNNEISIVREEDGLLSNTIRSLADVGDGSIFIGTNLGLNRFFPAGGKIFSYTRRNGFPGIESKPGAALRSSNGDLWFGSANGVVRLSPSKLIMNEIEPLTHIKELRDFSGPREMKDGLRRRYNDNDLIFDYYSICLADPDMVEYRIMLAGFDDEWRSVADQTRAVYQKLPPGKYTFMVIARNNEGRWNSTPASYSFTIKPPFWKTWWFVVLSAAITMMGIAGYIKIREEKLIREKLVLENKVKERTAEVVQKSMEIEEKNRDITASIRYAERIQRAMLPPEDTFNETFVLFLPKDIVSGDFYWMYDNGDQQFIAAADCTGHGVPGAFMSIIGHNSLNKIVREYGITRPSAILDQLNVEVTRALLQRDEKAITDGMDIALITFNKKNLTVEYAGAYNPLYLVRKGELIIYRGDRIPIGMTRAGVKKRYTNHAVNAHPGDMLYIFSDGYADQFGWREGKKFKIGNIRRLLTEIYHLPVAEQRSRLMDELSEWKGDLAQVDDILMIGTRMPEF